MSDCDTIVQIQPAYLNINNVVLLFMYVGATIGYLSMFFCFDVGYALWVNLVLVVYQ